MRKDQFNWGKITLRRDGRLVLHDNFFIDLHDVTKMEDVAFWLMETGYDPEVDSNDLVAAFNDIFALAGKSLRPVTGYLKMVSL